MVSSSHPEELIFVLLIDKEADESILVESQAGIGEVYSFEGLLSIIKFREY